MIAEQGKAAPFGLPFCRGFNDVPTFSKAKFLRPLR